jgi:putative membrane protein
MKRASTLFTEADHRRVTEAVARAEARSSAEIVPVIASSSGRYDRAEDMAGLWFGFISLGVGWWLLQGVELSEWGVPQPRLGLMPVMGLMLGGWLLGVVLAHLSGTLRLLFTPRREQREEVERAARQAFFDRRIHHTEGSSGLLVYVSMLERMAVVLADAQVLEKLGQPKVDALCASLVSELKKGRYTDALCNTIDEAGAALAEALPAQAQNRNELADALVVVD